MDLRFFVVYFLSQMRIKFKEMHISLGFISRNGYNNNNESIGFRI